MAAWSFLVPLPPSGLGQNARAGWAARQRLSRDYAREVVAAVWAASARPQRPLRRARLTLQARYCAARPRPALPGFLRALFRYRPTDLDNLVGAMKPAIDALQPGSPLDGRCNVIMADDSDHLELAVLPPVAVGSHAEEGVLMLLEER